MTATDPLGVFFMTRWASGSGWRWSSNDRDVEDPAPNIDSVRASQLVSSTTLMLCEDHQGADRPALIDMSVNSLASSCPDPPPYPYQARAPEKFTLNGHAVEAVHVLKRVNPSQVQVCRKNFKLGTAVQHENFRLSFRSTLMIISLF
jgi:hypothetical protein